MSTELPLYAQEKRNTCALACLRMVLAAYGTHVQEGELEAQARMEPNGTPIDELQRLARQFQLVAEIQDATVAELRDILAEGKFPIVYLDRAVFEMSPRQWPRHLIRDAIIHNVIPVRVTSKSVTFHDPRQNHVTRKTMRFFRRAYIGLGGRCVVCWKPDMKE